MENIGLDKIEKYELDLLNYTTQRLSGIDGLNFIGTAPGKVSVLSFTMDCAHPHDIATIVDQDGVAVRAGHHCAQPLMERLIYHRLPGQVLDCIIREKMLIFLLVALKKLMRFSNDRF